MTHHDRRRLQSGALLVALLLANRADAADRFVATTGGDAANACATASQPCRTIAHAIAQASSGDVVKVARGTYREFLVVDQSIALRLSGGWSSGFVSRDPLREVTTLRKGKAAAGLRPALVVAHAGESDGPPVTETIDLVVDGFTLGPNDAGAIAALAADGSSVTVEVVDTAVRRLATASAAVAARAEGSGVTSLALTRTRIVDNRPRSHSLGGAIDLTGYQGGTVAASLVNAIVAGNRTGGSKGMIEAWASGAGSRVDLSIRHSTVTSFNGPGVRLGEYFAGTTTLDLASSILWWNGRAAGPALRLEGHLDGTVTADASDNLLGSRSIAFGTFNDLGGNVDADPLFAQPRRSYRLRADSMAVDAVSCALSPPTDIEGDPRPAGSACDLGADELAP